MSAQPARSEPLFNIPAVVVALLAIMVLVQLGRGFLNGFADDNLLAWFAFVPGRLTFAFDPVGVMKHMTALRVSSSVDQREQAAWASVFLQRGGAAPWTVLTYAFLHGGWTHLGLNGIWMVAFGTPVARRFGAGRFLALMAIGAIGGALAHWICYPYGFAPVVGASAGISGLMGAAVRFMFQNDPRIPEAWNAKPLSLMAVFRERRALSFIVVWFVSNSLFGMGAGTLGLSDAPVAWQAHVGGFLVGLLLFPWFDPLRGDGMAAEELREAPPSADLALPEHKE